MIYVKSPLRISLFGGGTDLPDFFEKHTGTVTGFTINRFVHIFASKIDINQGFNFRLSYKSSQDAINIDEIKHPIFREVFRDYNFDQTYHFTTMSCLPSGAGLGSSSSFTVGLYFTLNQILNKKNSSKALAKQAINIERNILNESGGWQDQLHAAYGGFNTFNFSKSGKITHNPIILSSESIELINNNMYILYSGLMREAKKIEQSKSTNMNINNLKEAFHLAKEGESIIRSNKFELSEIGKLLNHSWELKKRLSKKVSSDKLNDLYNLILKNGAYGAKLCGAGGGGFFMVLANKKSIKKLETLLPKSTISKVSIDFTGLKRVDL
jgi:D-glycero-alpha-D-manno-heptose-7-phosphate kinase